jgi:hypothetical protein
MDSSSLQVDATFLVEKNKKAFVYICKINIPVRYFDDDSVRERVHSYIMGEFYGFQPTFQIWGSFLLKHRQTGEEKVLTGPFFTNGSMISTYTRANLQSQLGRLTEAAALWASSNEVDPQWIYHGPKSAIINLNVRVPRQFGLVVCGLNLPGEHLCFELPQMP